MCFLAHFCQVIYTFDFFLLPVLQQTHFSPTELCCNTPLCPSKDANSFLISTLCMNNGKLSSHIVNSWIHSKILVLKMGCDCPRQCVYVVSVVQIYPIFSHSKSSHVITFLSWYHLLQLHHCFSSILHHWWAAATLMAVCSTIYAICQHEHFLSLTQRSSFPSQTPSISTHFVLVSSSAPLHLISTLSLCFLFIPWLHQYPWVLLEVC